MQNEPFGDDDQARSQRDQEELELRRILEFIFILSNTLSYFFFFFSDLISYLTHRETKFQSIYVTYKVKSLARRDMLHNGPALSGQPLELHASGPFGPCVPLHLTR